MCRDGVCGIHLFSIIIDWHPMVKIVFKLKLKYNPDYRIDTVKSNPKCER
jgi:hypothetical protein